MKETVTYSPRLLITNTINQHHLPAYDHLSIQDKESLENKIAPFIAPDLLHQIKEAVGVTLWSQMLYALDQTKRWGRDKTLDVISGKEKFEESNFDHSISMIKRMDKLLTYNPEFQHYLGDKKDFIVGILLHDLPEAFVGDMPAFGVARDSDLGQQVKRMESLVFSIMMAPRIQNTQVRKHWKNIYRDVTNNKTSEATPRARILRFLDKWDGTSQAFKQFYKNAPKAIASKEISNNEIDDHVSQSLEKVSEAASKLQSVLAPNHQHDFATFLATTVQPEFTSYVPHQIKPNGRRTYMPNQ